MTHSSLKISSVCCVMFTVFPQTTSVMPSILTTFTRNTIVNALLTSGFLSRAVESVTNRAVSELKLKEKGVEKPEHFFHENFCAKCRTTLPRPAISWHECIVI